MRNPTSSVVAMNPSAADPHPIAGESLSVRGKLSVTIWVGPTVCTIRKLVLQERALKRDFGQFHDFVADRR